MTQTEAWPSQIRSARLRQHVGVRELARRTGVTPAAVTKWERSEAQGTAQITTIARALNALGETLVMGTRPIHQQASQKLERREDRVALELHRAVAHKLITDPELVRARVPINLRVLRDRVRSSFSQGWLDEWEMLTTNRSVGDLIDVMLGTSQRSIDMRQVSPFSGVLNQEERVSAIEKARLP